MTRLPRLTLKSLALEIAGLAGFVLALESSAQGATSLSVELPEAPGAPAVVEVHDLPLPAGGAIVTVNAHLCYLRMPTPLTTFFVLGGGSGGSDDRGRDMRSAIYASPDFLTSLQNDPNATLTLTVCGNGGRACTISVPFPVRFDR